MIVLWKKNARVTSFNPIINRVVKFRQRHPLTTSKFQFRWKQLDVHKTTKPPIKSFAFLVSPSKANLSLQLFFE